VLFRSNLDPDLSEVGLAQASWVAARLKQEGIPLTHIYSSPCMRTAQTAQKIYEVNCETRAEFKPDLAEYGYLWGKPTYSWLTLKSMYPSFDTPTLDDSDWTGGITEENEQSMENRARRVLNWILAYHPPESDCRVCLVSHDFFMHALFRVILHITDPLIQFSSDHTGVTEFNITVKDIGVIWINSTTHLWVKPSLS
jgi:broad specificity phosphatase PhoE